MNEINPKYENTRKIFVKINDKWVVTQYSTIQVIYHILTQVYLTSTKFKL
jgi:hypothetical protein